LNPSHYTGYRITGRSESRQARQEPKTVGPPPAFILITSPNLDLFSILSLPSFYPQSAIKSAIRTNICNHRRSININNHHYTRKQQSPYSNHRLIEHTSRFPFPRVLVPRSSFLNSHLSLVDFRRENDRKEGQKTKKNHSSSF